MYPRNNASPEPIAIGAVVQISDGAVQTSGVTVRIIPIGVAEDDGGGTVAYSTNGVVVYTPTQSETNYTSFVLIATKASCIPVAITVVTTASATPGTVLLAPVTHTNSVLPRVTLVDTTTTNTDMRGNDTAPATPANVTDARDAVLTAITNLNNLSALVNLYGSTVMEIPDSGSTVFAFTLVVRDNEGKLVALDADPTIAAANAAGTDRSANLSAVSNPATGRYTFTYSVASTAVHESIRITATGAVSAEARYTEIICAVVDYDYLTTIEAINTKLGTPAVSIADDIATRASQTSVDDVPTNAEFAAGLAAADDAVLAAISALDVGGSGVFV